MTGTRSVSTSRCTAARSPRAHAIISWNACLSGSGPPSCIERSIRKLLFLLRLLLRPATCNSRRVNSRKVVYSKPYSLSLSNSEVWVQGDRVTPQMWTPRLAHVIILPT